ncbi:glycosyltransferase family 4 protein [Thalassococcus sp. S3]|uniref:glycosyltransferase family 4 protein n=1 Tax=Thalassococcus sp. S3 TaxID=2017482 RepID=UPI0010248EED|nr:glycosyltransferase family 4 protein [Thalassococcus sp. S3]QBF34191.1 glycosyl transferase family 1 [Thalassococcus sp. S3]
MKILFVHQNMPGQYRELIKWLVDRGEHEIVFLTQRENVKLDGVKTHVYRTHHVPKEDAYGLSKVWEEAAGMGFGAAMAVQEIERKDGFRPDIVIGHVGWGELTFFKQIMPDVPIIGFFEYFYMLHGGPVNFDPEETTSEHTPFLLHARNVVPSLNIQSVDLGHSPTEWQRDTFPKSFHDKIYVCHDGIRTDQLRPDANVSLKLGRLPKPLTRDDEVFTYLARNMERTRGFHQIMRALPKILEARPNARVLMIGGNETSYGRKSEHPGGLRGEMEREVGDRLDWDRVHFLGRVPYNFFKNVVQISRCHIYLTMPFVLSWSLLEAMAMEATIVSSDVAPVREVMTHGKTGLLVDFFDAEQLADQVIEVLSNQHAYAHLGPAAREHVVKNYDFLTKCLPQHIEHINSLVPPEKAIRI